MDILLPLKSKKVPANEPPWVNKKLKSLIIHDRQSKWNYLRDCEPRRWWKEVKKLAGMQSATRTAVTSLLRNIDPVPNPDLTVLANTINDTFLAPMNEFAPLDPQVHHATQQSCQQPTHCH